MFPDSAGTVLGILFVVAPGLVFEVIREHRRPTVERSAFREASSVALASLAFSCIALLLVAAVRAFWSRPFPDFKLWAQAGLPYAMSHFWQIATFLMLWALLSVGGAVLVALIAFRRSEARIDPNTTAWFELFRNRVPTGTLPMASVRLEDGSEYVGEIIYYDANILPAERELILGPPLWHRLPDQAELTLLPEKDDWRRVVIAAPRILCMWVRYPPRSEGDGRKPRRWWTRGDLLKPTGK